MSYGSRRIRQSEVNSADHIKKKKKRRRENWCMSVCVCAVDNLRCAVHYSLVTVRFLEATPAGSLPGVGGFCISSMEVSSLAA
jgi:hypothetical protein